jgi:DnaK suppressor protein
LVNVHDYEFSIYEEENKMKSSEYNDPIAPRSKADAAVTRAALNNARLANKKGVAKKATPKPVAKKAAAPKPTDSRFSGVKKADPKKPTDSRFTVAKKAAPNPTDSRFKYQYNPKSAAGQPAILPPSTKSATAKKTVIPAKKAAAPAQKTKPRFGGFSLAAAALTPDWKKREQAAKAAKKSK